MAFGFGPGPLPMMMASGGSARRALVDSTTRFVPSGGVVPGVLFGPEASDRVLVIVGLAGNGAPSQVWVGEGEEEATVEVAYSLLDQTGIFVAVVALPTGTAGPVKVDQPRVSILGVYACNGVSAAPVDMAAYLGSSSSTIQLPVDTVGGGLLLAIGSGTGSFAGVTLDAASGATRYGSGVAIGGSADVELSSALSLAVASLAPL